MRELRVIIPVADMRSVPDHRSERVSQALYGHSVRELEITGEFLRIETFDGYSGWMGRSYMGEENDGETNPMVVTSATATFESDDPDARLTLPYSAKIKLLDKHRFASHNGATLSLVHGNVANAQPISLDQMLIEARSLISSPYLWGGSSSFGFDCSGFTQSLFRRCGITLPRDSMDQLQAGREFNLEDSVPGDLIFFPGHVAVHLGAFEILHASRLRGMVAIESLQPKNPHYRADLADKMTKVIRML